MKPAPPLMKIRLPSRATRALRSEEHTSELQSQSNLVCRLLLEKNNQCLNRMARHRSAAVSRPSWLDLNAPGTDCTRLGVRPRYVLVERESASNSESVGQLTVAA